MQRKLTEIIIVFCIYMLLVITILSSLAFLNSKIKNIIDTTKTRKLKIEQFLN